MGRLARIAVLIAMSVLFLPTIGLAQAVVHLYIWNNTDESVETYMDGSFMCSMPTGGKCVYELPIGTHRFRAVFSSGKSEEVGGNIDRDRKWCLYPVENQAETAACMGVDAIAESVRTK